ncbi:restriction endonuclease subunit S [Cronobacter dublinensis]|nr:restriction endonuclease subunit S [Cronobacter dublinensis]ELY3969137.1 restriction endonuclease subunit S [Cronobacter dublinensis]ELY4485118.1 restriction endonuclease subunit S [Cronobacter dublinensis]ELY5821813.1 restriction endonuclease subunit S [Cronobacter dublinensis]
MAKYKAYPEYKDSGVEWLGEIPAHWLIKKLKYLCKVQTGSRDTVNAVENGKYPFFVRSQTIERINSVGAECEAVLTAGDGVGVGKVYHYYDGKFDFHQRVYMLNEFHSITGKFVYYYLSSNFYKVALEGNAKSTVDSLRLPQFLNFEFSIPNLDEQKNLILFIEHETAKIDNLIEKQQQLIELLKEKRQAVISHAVTKGLNPDVPMKDSGVEWLGDVPEHWTISRYKFCTSRVIVGIAEAATHAYSDSGTPIIRSTNIKEDGLNTTDLLYLKNEFARQNESKYLFSNDIVTVRTGYPGISAVIPETLNGSHCFTNLISTPLHSQHAKYLTEYLNSAMGKEYFALNGWGSAQKNISVPILQNFPIAYPDSDEQREISTFVTDKRDEFSHILEKADESIRLMQERRTALISAAVTGKIDVRDWVAPDTQDVEEPQEATA